MSVNVITDMSKCIALKRKSQKSLFNLLIVGNFSTQNIPASYTVVNKYSYWHLNKP